MKLATAKAGQVVRNANNGSHYRFERQERGKIRIFPLELFPNGLLIAKPTPTLVEPDLDVVLIGTWAEGMVVEGKPSQSRRVYENELVKREVELVMLEEEYEKLPTNGKGKQSRGSWANKVINCRARIATLKLGLGFVDASNTVHAPVATPDVGFAKGDGVQAPSGRLALVVGFQQTGDQTYVQIKTRLDGEIVAAAFPAETLLPAQQARLCSV